MGRLRLSLITRRSVSVSFLPSTNEISIYRRLPSQAGDFYFAILFMGVEDFSREASFDVGPVIFLGAPILTTLRICCRCCQFLFKVKDTGFRVYRLLMVWIAHFRWSLPILFGRRGASVSCQELLGYFVFFS